MVPRTVTTLAPRRIRGCQLSTQQLAERRSRRPGWRRRMCVCSRSGRRDGLAEGTMQSTNTQSQSAHVLSQPATQPAHHPCRSTPPTARSRLPPARHHRRTADRRRSAFRCMTPWMMGTSSRRSRGRPTGSHRSPSCQQRHPLPPPPHQQHRQWHAPSFSTTAERTSTSCQVLVPCCRRTGVGLMHNWLLQSVHLPHLYPNLAPPAGADQR